MKAKTTRTKQWTIWTCLCALMLSQLIAACGGNNGTAGSPNEISVWMYPSASEVGGPPADWFLTQKVKEELDITLKPSFMPLDADGDTKYNAAAAANNMPDLFQIPSNNNIFLQWVRLGLVAPVDSLFSEMPDRTKDRYSDEQMKKISTINGKQYVLQEVAGLNKRQGLFIRQDWLDNLGLEAPKTLEDFYNVARAFTYDDPDGNGKNDTYGFSAVTNSNLTGLGGHFNSFFGAYGIPGTWSFKNSGEISLTLHDPGYLKVIELLRKLSDEKIIDPDWPTLTTNDFRARWKQQGNYGIMSEDFCAGMCQGNYESFDANFPEGSWLPMQPPQGPDGTSSMGTYTNVGLRLAVSQKAIDAGKGPAIAKFLEWINKGEGYYMTAFGLENTHYTFNSQGNVTKEGAEVPFDSHEAAPLNQMRNLAYQNTPEELQARYTSFTTKEGRTQDPTAIYATISEMPWLDTTATFVVQPASNQNDINRYINENLVQFITGQKDLNAESWETFIKGLDNLNVADWEMKANQTVKEYGFL